MEVMSFGGDDTTKGNTKSLKIMMRGDDSLCECIVELVAFAFECVIKEDASSRAGKQFVIGSGC